MGAREDEEEEEEEEEEVEEGGEEVEGWEEETGTFSGATVAGLVGFWSRSDTSGLAISEVCSAVSHDCCKSSDWSAGGLTGISSGGLYGASLSTSLISAGPVTGGE